MAGLMDFLGIKPGPAPTAFQTTGTGDRPGVWPAPPLPAPAGPAMGMAPVAPAPAPPPVNVAGWALPPVQSQPAVNAAGWSTSSAPVSPGGGMAPPAPSSSEALALKKPAPAPAPAPAAAPAGRTGPIEVVRGGHSDNGNNASNPGFGGGVTLRELQALAAYQRPRISPTDANLYELGGAYQGLLANSIKQNQQQYSEMVTKANGDPHLMKAAEAWRDAHTAEIGKAYIDHLKLSTGLPGIEAQQIQQSMGGGGYPAGGGT